MLGHTQDQPRVSTTVAYTGKGVSSPSIHHAQAVLETHPDCSVSLLRCPYTGDNYQTQLIPVQKAVDLPFPSHHQRFSISTFSFVDNTVAKEALKGPV